MNTISNEHLVNGLIAGLKTLAGEGAPKDIDWESSVLKVWGLDSEDGVDLASDLGQRVGVEVPLRENPLIEEDGSGRKRARSFREVIEYLEGLTNSTTHVSEG